MTRQVTVEVPEEGMKAIDDRPDHFSEKLREAAVIRWFEEGKLSQGQASSFLSVTRAEFFDVLAIHKVSPIQMSTEDLESDFRRG